MEVYTTWVTIKNGRIGKIREVSGTMSPGQDWTKVPNDWKGNSGDKREWFDENMRRFGDDNKLVELGLRKNNKGRVYNIKDKRSRVIYNFDEELHADETKEPPLENEPYQKWDEKKEKWVVDTESKEKAEKEQHIAEKKNAIHAAEQQIIRSLIAKESGIATKEDEQFFEKFSNEIKILRAELQEIQE